MVTKATPRAFSDLAVPPGELLAEELGARGMTQKELADRTGRPEQKISEIINGKKSITHDTALELEKVLGISAEFWVNLEGSYQLTKARLREKSELEGQEDWLDFFPVRELQERGYVPRTRDRQEKLTALLKFFGVASFPALRQRQEAFLPRYRITPKSKVSEGALWAWLRVGAIQAREADTAPYSQSRFLAVLTEIRPLTTEGAKVLPRVIELCASAGVAFVVVKQFPKSGANGVVRWLATDKAMIQLSTMRAWTDIFWFTFFHEARHVLDRQKKHAFVNGVDGINDDPETKADADKFAQDMLVPPGEWAAFVASGTWSRLEVKDLAQRVGIHPGIVVGRLQHEHLIPYNSLNDLRSRFVWRDDE